METQKIIEQADEAFFMFEFEKAIKLFNEIKRNEILDSDRFNVLNKLCLIYESENKEEQFEQNAFELIELSNTLGKSDSKEVKKIKEFLERIRLEKEERERPVKVLNLIGIGYWETEKESSFPNPNTYQVNYWNKDEKEMILKHLFNGRKVLFYRGFSWCRFNCGESDMGTTCMTDGYYIYPEKLTHYIEKHELKLPDEFIKHVKNYVPIGFSAFNIEIGEIDYSWWINSKV